ncbi:hypothetical protein [Mycobacterium camsae]|uniref:hypothetical protein n=1 Tax=Mycobacterium gordonae TaxID=1778 RepID=UPI00197E4CE8|nr:hypothetical protein [Mycobacterium gordonae]
MGAEVVGGEHGVEGGDRGVAAALGLAAGVGVPSGAAGSGGGSAQSSPWLARTNSVRGQRLDGQRAQPVLDVIGRVEDLHDLLARA